MPGGAGPLVLDQVLGARDVVGERVPLVQVLAVLVPASDERGEQALYRLCQRWACNGRGQTQCQLGSPSKMAGVHSNGGHGTSTTKSQLAMLHPLNWCG